MECTIRFQRAIPRKNSGCTSEIDLQWVMMRTDTRSQFKRLIFNGVIYLVYGVATRYIGLFSLIAGILLPVLFWFQATQAQSVIVD
jgi:hypothetical protein